MSSWYSSWFPGLPSLNITLPSSLQGRFISFVLKKSLGHFLKPGQLDSSQIDSKLGSGLVHINDLELDNEAINALLLDIPVELQVGSISSVIARIPWPNPLSSIIGFSVDSLHLTFRLLSTSLHSAHSSSQLAASVASVAESFIHDELSSQEGAALWDSFHQSTVPAEQPRDDLAVPGGLSADPFLTSPEEAMPDMDPAGVSVFATLIERLLARFEFDATNTKVTLVHPENMSITATISDIRYNTGDSRGGSGSESIQFRGQRRTLSITGLTISTSNLSSDIPLSGLFTPTSHSPLSPGVPSSVPDGLRPDSPSASSSSSMDDEAQFAMSQSLAFLPARQDSPSSSVASSMYQSAISTAPAPSIVDNGSRTPSPRDRPAHQPLTTNNPLPERDREVLVSFGSSSILLHITTPPPPAIGTDDPSISTSTSKHDVRAEQETQFTLSLGVIACVLQAWQIRALLKLAKSFPSPSPENNPEPQPSIIDYKVVVNLRGIVILLPLPPLCTQPVDGPLVEFFKWPLVPPALPYDYGRLYIDTVSASLSPSTTDNVSGHQGTKSSSTAFKSLTCTLTIADLSLFYIQGSSPEREIVASPILITDPDLFSHYDLLHRHPSKSSIDPSLPTFDIVDWTADKYVSNGLKLTLWRTKPRRTRNMGLNQRGGTTPPSSSAVSINVIVSSRREINDLSNEAEVKIVPLHVFFDLGKIIGVDEISNFLDGALGGDHRRSHQDLESDYSDGDSSGGDTPSALPKADVEAERKRLEKMVLEDLDLGLDYGTKQHTRSTKRLKKKATRGPTTKTTIILEMIRIQIRCPSPLRHSPRSGALLIDVHNVRLSTLPEPQKTARFGTHFVQKSRRPQHIIGAVSERIIVAYSHAGDTTAKSILSIGSLAPNNDDALEPVTPSLFPRIAITRSVPVAVKRSEVFALSIDVPSVVVDISKPIFDGLQYWTDDVAQYMDKSLDVLTEKAYSRDGSLIGSRFFAKSRSGSGSAWSSNPEVSPSETVMKVSISEGFVRVLVARAPTLEPRTFIVHSSDIDILVEPKPEGKDEMVFTLELMDVTVKEIETAASSLTYLSLTSPRSLTSTPKPLVKLRFTSLIIPETMAKESRVKVTLSGFTFNVFPDFSWVKDLMSFVQSPPGTFESVIPSERTRISLRIIDGAIRAFAPNHPGAIVVQIDEVDFGTDVVGDALDASFRLSVPSLAFLAVDDVHNDVDYTSSSSRRGIAFWKASGFALIAEVEDLFLVHTINRLGTDISIDRVRLRIHIAADSLSAVTAFADDLGSIFRPSTQERHVEIKPRREPTLVSKRSSSSSGLMASVDDLAFKTIPEVGPAPDMISDDLPTNLDYLDESFGAAAGLRELRDDDLDEFDVDEPQPVYSDAVLDGTGVISRVGGETIKMLHPEGINITENYFDTLPPQSTADEYGETSFQLRVNDGDITLFLYDGYDWSKTRRTIEEKIKEVRRRLAKIRQLVASGQVQDPSVDDTGALLYNSIYIGLDHDVDGLEPGAIIAAIDEELKEDVETASQSSWQSLKTPTSAKLQTRSVRVHGKRLTRSRSPSMEFHFSGLAAEVDHYLPDAALLSRTFITVRDLEILDHIKTSTWKKFLTELRADSRGNVRETDSNMVRVELRNVRPVPSLPATEVRLRAKLLPLRLYVDQDAVDFLKSFFSFKDPHASPATDSGGDEIYFQSAEVFPVDLKLDYKPRRVDYRALREGRTIELMNFFHFDGAEMTLRHITLAGVSGWARLGELLNDLWTPDVKATQLVEVVSGVAPIRSVVNVGSGVADLVLLPISQYKKDGRIVRGVQKGTTAFVKSTAIEAIKLGARLATGTQVILEQAEGVLGGQFNHSITTETVMGTGDEYTDVEGEENEDPEDIISKYAQQPADIKEGVQSAYKSLRRNFSSAAQTILAVPMEVYERSGNEGPVRSVIRAVPIAVLKPMIGASEAVSKTLLGLHNSLDPDVRHENEAKYKRR